jgi:hypothetical protein
MSLKGVRNSGKKLLERSINTWDTINDKVNSAGKDGLTFYVLISKEISGHQEKI